MARFVQLSMAASKLAVARRASRARRTKSARRAGCFIGVGLGGLEGIEAMGRTLDCQRAEQDQPVLHSVGHREPRGRVRSRWRYGLRGPSYCNTSACSSSAHAIGEAFEWIRRGRADVMVAGGAESTITGLGIGGFCAMFALSRRNAEPARASRPFDKGRDGFVIGEGAGTLILESLTRARSAARRSTPRSPATAPRATRTTSPSPRPKGQGRSARCAWRSKTPSVDPSAVDYINAHGTSTPVGDIEESRAIEKVFGDHATSQEALGIIDQVDDGAPCSAEPARSRRRSPRSRSPKAVVPPTINLEDQDPECRLDYVPNVARERRITHAMSNSFGFGGTNASLLLSRFVV